MMIDLIDAIIILDRSVPNPSAGLPDELFYYISRTTPLVNVDLLIKDEQGRSLLSWRDDQYTGRGWHLPGGIIRLKETMRERLEKVAKTEIGTAVEFETEPLAVNEIILPQKVRGHFISFLFRGKMPGGAKLINDDLKETDAGYLKWHEVCPDDILKAQKIYAKYF